MLVMMKTAELGWAGAEKEQSRSSSRAGEKKEQGRNRSRVGVEQGKKQEQGKK